MKANQVLKTKIFLASSMYFDFMNAVKNQTFKLHMDYFNEYGRKWASKSKKSSHGGIRLCATTFVYSALTNIAVYRGSALPKNDTNCLP